MTTSDRSVSRRDSNAVAPLTVARLTPSGRAAIAVVGVSGTGARELLNSRWTRGDGERFSTLDEDWLPEFSGRPIFGLFHFDLPDGVADEIVLRWRAPEVFELDCHGGDLVTSRIVEFFVNRGAQLVDGCVWAREASIFELSGSVAPDNFSPELTELFLDASDALTTRTTTEETAKLACDQRDAWLGWFNRLAERVSVATVDSVGREEALSGLVSLIDSVDPFGLGVYLVTPFVVAIVGAPNVGKSSLLNALLGYERALSSPVPGTTRDLIGASLVYAGWNFRFVDGAGLRETSDPIERAGVALATDVVAHADAILRVYDPTLERAEQDATFMRFCPEVGARARQVVLSALNKRDIAAENWTPDWRNAKREEGMFLVSARNGVGLEALLDGLFAATVGEMGAGIGIGRDFGLKSPQRSAPLLWNEEQRLFLKRLN